jgi:hypothetical protein
MWKRKTWANMKIRATLAALMITAAIAPSANASQVPMGIGPEGTKLRSEIIDNGFGCTKIKDATFTCTHKNKKVTLTARLIGGTYPSSGKLSALQVTAHVRSGQPWIKHFMNEFKSYAPEYEGINLDSWVNQSCLKNKTTHLGGYNQFGRPVLIWGINYSIKGSNKACTLEIWGHHT